LIALLTGCGASATINTPAALSGPTDDAGCQPYHSYGRFPGRTVSVLAGFLAPDDRSYTQSFATFERCTGITVRYEGSSQLETELKTRIDSGDAPDLAFIPQPGLLNALVAGGSVKPAPAAVEQLVDRDWSKDWKRYGTVRGKFYAAPAGADVKSLIWYSPGFFEQNHLSVPRTWSELMALTERLARSGSTLKGAGRNFKPWCAGFNSGSATGWPGTDWVEDMLLHAAGPDVYDQWTQHRIPFNAPQVKAAFTRAGSILKNERYVNGGAGGVRTINSTRWQDGGQGILNNQCALHRQASFYSGQWPRGTAIGDQPTDGVFAFALPPIDPELPPVVLGAGEFVAAFSDRPAVQAFQTFLASPLWVNTRAQLGGWTSADRKLDTSRMTDQVQKLSAEQLANPRAVFRFDASDLMPAKVGAGTFWTGMVDWIGGDSPSQVTDQIEGSWPAG